MHGFASRKAIAMGYIRPVTFRPYQRKLIIDFRDALRSGKQAPIIQLATGGGKTVIYCDMRLSESQLRLYAEAHNYRPGWVYYRLQEQRA
jgi:hypothetical protein